MAARTKANPRWLRSTSDTFQQIDPLGHLGDGDAVWAAGEFLRKASDGLLYECATSGTSIVASAITHWALTDHLTADTGDDTVKHVVADVLAEDVWEMNLYNNATMAATARGLEYGMNVSSGVVCTLTTSETTYTPLRIVNPAWNERLYQDDSADTYPRIAVQVLQTYIDAKPTT